MARRLENSLSLLHLFAGERLQTFSDAVFSIIATLMVLPLKLDHHEVADLGGLKKFDLEKFITDLGPRYLVYVYSFTLVVDTWYSHVGIFNMVEQVDDVLLWLNLLCLLFISFLPYGIGLVSSFPTSRPAEHLAVTICSLDIMLIGLVMLLILLHVFRKQSLLHPEIENNDLPNIRSVRRASVISVLIPPVMALLSMCFSFLTPVPEISLVIFYSIGIISIITRFALSWYYKRKLPPNLSSYIFKREISKFRTEAFSDGLFAIVATLIVLDLTVDNIPSFSEVHKSFNGDLASALYAQRYVYVSFIMSFVIVGLLWFVHYGMMHFIERVTPSLSSVNMLMLFLIGGVPFVTGLHTVISYFPGSEGGSERLDDDRVISVRCISVLLFLISMGQLIFWTVAIFQKKTCLSKKVDERHAESLQFSKLLVFPITSLIIFWGTFSRTFIHYGLYNLLLFLTPFVFLLLKVLFRAKRIMKKIQHKLADRTVNSDNQTYAVNYSDEKKALITEEKDQNTAGTERSSAATYIMLSNKDKEKQQD